jgi:hypothetical protein
MSGAIDVIVDADADRRWREWRAKYAEDDRRRGAAMSKLAIVVGTGLVIALASALMAR